MKNPFEEFKEYKRKRREIPLDSIVESKDIVMDKIMKGYERLLEEEVKELVWLARYNTIMRAYSIAEEHVKSINYEVEDIEDFCFELDNTEKIPYLISGPSGLYLSALCNNAKEDEIILKLNELERKIPLLGYRLPEGKRLVVEGDMGDFTGVGMEGGELVIEGSARNCTGAGMRGGRITVKKNVGYHTGEWMMGGEIWIGGRIGGLGNVRGGKIYEMDKLVYPATDRKIQGFSRTV